MRSARGGICSPVVGQLVVGAEAALTGDTRQGQATESGQNSCETLSP